MTPSLLNRYTSTPPAHTMTTVVGPLVSADIGLTYPEETREQMAKTKPTKVSVDKFIATVENDTRRADAKTLLRVFKEATGWTPQMLGPTTMPRPAARSDKNLGARASSIEGKKKSVSGSTSANASRASPTVHNGARHECGSRELQGG